MERFKFSLFSRKGRRSKLKVSVIFQRFSLEIHKLPVYSINLRPPATHAWAPNLMHPKLEEQMSLYVQFSQIQYDLSKRKELGDVPSYYS